jgi:hypothetical protein
MVFTLIRRGRLLSSVLFLGLVFGLAAPATLAQPTSRPANAAQGAPRLISPQRAQMPALTGSFSTWIGNRTRMIQVALVAVGLGILILHKGNK